MAQISKDMKNERKLYYGIGETAKMFHVEISTIRYWEKQFSILKPKKNKRGVRYFRQTDIENLHIIYHLLKEKGMTIEGAKEYLKNQEATIRNKIKVLAKLEKIYTQLENINKQIVCTE